MKISLVNIFFLAAAVLWSVAAHSQELYIPKNLPALEKARSYARIADEDESPELYRSALREYDKALTEVHDAADSINIYSESAIALCGLELRDEMRIRLQKAVDLAAIRYGEESDIFLAALIDAADACNMAGDYRQACSLLRRCRRISPDFNKKAYLKAAYVTSMAYNDCQSGKEIKAFRRIRAQNRKVGKTDGRSGEKYMASLLDVSGYAQSAGRNLAAARYHGKAREYSAIVLEHFGELSEAGRERFWRQTSPYYERTLELAQTYSGMAEDAYDAVLFTKGILLNTSAAFGDFVRESNDSTIIADYENMGRLRLSGAPDLEIDSLDQKIVGRMQELGLKFTDKNAICSWKDVRDALGRDDIAIEFFGSSKDRFGAVLLKKEWDKPRITMLRQDIRANGSTVFWKDSLGVPIQKELDAAAMDEEWKISKAVWNRQIRRHFPRTPGGRVFFSPSAEMNLSGLEYLPAYKPVDGKRSETLADCYRMYRLSSTSRIPAHNSAASGSLRAGLYGGMNYSAQPGGLKKALETVSLGGQNTSDTAYERMITEGYEVDRDKLQPLPASVGEVHIVHEILADTTARTDMLTGRYASEDAFKLLSSQENIIHLATHGFYFKADAAAGHPYFKIYADTNPQFLSDPLHRSGIHFAGSQRAWDGFSAIPGLEDGVLCATEISLLDLRKTILVVLSSCESGLGDASRDGVFGLQRAFKKAGANAMVLSLWKVDDEPAQLLMGNFYRNMFVLGKPMHEAFHTARRQLMATPGYSAPYYWSSFVLLDPYEPEN